MRSKELEIYSELLRNIGGHASDLPNQDLTGFLSMRGHKAAGELIVIGRAVNGWATGWKPADLTQADKLHAIVAETLNSVENQKVCPMCWVSAAWGDEEHYNTARSAFWRVIRNVTGDLIGIDIENEEWPSHLIWSNLYKIAPAEGGNPSNFLCDLQFEGCFNLFEHEILQNRSKRVLMLTGLDWARPFLDKLGVTYSETQNTKYVDAIGKFSQSGTCLETNFVIAKHPQGKQERIWIDEVLSSF